MKDKTIGVVGHGFVGSAIVHGFAHYVKEIRIYDKDKSKSGHTFEDTINSDIVFVCLPTPMKDVTGSECNLSIIKGFFEEVMDRRDIDCSPVFVIKSTVPVGTTRMLQDKYQALKIVHNPEFLTARNAKIDFITPSRNIVGGMKEEARKPVVDILKSRFPGVTCLEMTSDESEMVKYMANCFFSVKVMFFNEMKQLAVAMGLDWENLISGVLTDGRIGVSHYQVPGHDGHWGVGGLCFPKDINSMIATCYEHNIDPKVLKAAWDKNLEVRPEEAWDWALSPSAVLKED